MAHTAIRPSDVLQTILEHPRRLITPVAVITLLAATFALLRQPTWEASQALVVRNEAGDSITRPGKFAHTDEMKTLQETILELAGNRGVLVKALQAVGPAGGKPATGAWPTEGDVEALQGNVKVTPPKGAEFGKTEVFYLKVRANDYQRAVALAGAVCTQVQARFDALREAKANSTTNELERTSALAQADLAQATNDLSTMELSVGSDLSELRILNESPSGDSDLRRTVTELERELRTYRAAYEENEAHLALLSAAQEHSDVMAIPSALIKAQPALGRLKDGLVDAQLRTGALRGPMFDKHPLVVNARLAENAVRKQLYDEINAAKRGVEVDMQINAERIRTLDAQTNALQARLNRLAGVRAEYANLVAASKSRGETLKNVQNELAEARATGAAAHAGSLINLLDTPFAGSSPIGPGRVVILFAGVAGGLLAGLALVFLTVNPAESQGRRVDTRDSATPNLSLRYALQRVTKTGLNSTR